MCGIIGYSGSKNAGDTIIKGLHALEYRGYDSAGMSVCEEENIRAEFHNLRMFVKIIKYQVFAG